MQFQKQRFSYNSRSDAVSTENLKLKGSVREIGIMRDADKFDTFNITFGIVIKNDIKINYEEAEKLTLKFRRDYLGKEVEFLSVNLPCPICNKILNTQTSLKRHILKQHPEKTELINPPKIDAKLDMIEKPPKKQQSNKTKKNTIKTKNILENNKKNTISSEKNRVKKSSISKNVKKQNVSEKKVNREKNKKIKTSIKKKDNKQQKLI